MNLYEPSTIQLLRAKHGFNFTKSLGQNFLTNKSNTKQSEIETSATIKEIGILLLANNLEV